MRGGMMKRLLIEFTNHRAARHGRVESIKQAVRACTFIPKGQQQMMCDFLWLELLETGRMRQQTVEEVTARNLMDEYWEWRRQEAARFKAEHEARLKVLKSQPF